MSHQNELVSEVISAIRAVTCCGIVGPRRLIRGHLKRIKNAPRTAKERPRALFGCAFLFTFFRGIAAVFILF